jgi:hypothetical protein
MLRGMKKITRILLVLFGLGLLVAVAAPLGGVWWLRSRDREGSSGIVLHAVQSPDSL